MINFLETKVNDVKFEKEINIEWNEHTQKLAQLNETERLNAVQYIGTDHVYRFKLEASLFIKGERYGINYNMDIMADSYDEAEQAAVNYFIASNMHAITYYREQANTIEDCSCAFIISNLYTQEEANEANRLSEQEEIEMESFLSIL